jgi:hypothetical protein
MENINNIKLQSCTILHRPAAVATTAQRTAHKTWTLGRTITASSTAQASGAVADTGRPAHRCLEAAATARHVVVAASHVGTDSDTTKQPTAVSTYSPGMQTSTNHSELVCWRLAGMEYNITPCSIQSHGHGCHG